ncbi:MAG: helix-turn-helix domain-containing protein [Pseudomonadales bacterium]
MDFLIANGHQRSTAVCAENERFDYWRDAVCDEFVKLECDRVEDSVFNAELRGGVGVAELAFSEVYSDPQIVRRSKQLISKSTEADFLISFQLESQGLVRQDGREALLNPGSFALYDSTRPYSLTFEKRFRQFVIQMPNSVLSRHLMNPEQYTAIPISGTSGLGAVLGNFVFSLVKELHCLPEAAEDLSDNLVNMIAMAFSSSVLLEERSNASPVQDSLRRRIRHYIDNNLCNPKLNNSAIAHAMGISDRYLHKLFQEENETIHALITGKRLERAKELLMDEAFAGYTIERIAYSVGFVDSAHFSKTFKKHYGSSPSAFRR